MKIFITRVSYFSLIAFLLVLTILASYLYFDPFKVLRHYTDFSYPNVIPNRDYISTTMFLNNYPNHHYNSFILGSSRTLAFKPHSWSRYLDQNDEPFMFDASAESLFGIYTKLNYLDSIHAEIKNVLIVLCRDVSFAESENGNGHLFIKHPATTHADHLNFQLAFFKAYTSPEFLLNYFSYKILQRYEPYMEGYIENRKITFDTITNELNILDQEAEIAKSQEAYFARREALFYERTRETTDTVRRISQKHHAMLKDIRRILTENNTNYRIILSPLYDQIKFNPADLSLLKKEFGNHLYDFTGRNALTENKENYYETSHFRPNVGDSIFKIIYKQSYLTNNSNP